MLFFIVLIFCSRRRRKILVKGKMSLLFLFLKNTSKGIPSTRIVCTFFQNNFFFFLKPALFPFNQVCSISCTILDFYFLFFIEMEACSFCENLFLRQEPKSLSILIIGIQYVLCTHSKWSLQIVCLILFLQAKAVKSAGLQSRLISAFREGISCMPSK